MAYTFKTKLANRGNYGASRSLSKIKYIVIHYTANDGDTDEGNGNYFKNNVVEVSAHYFVDDDSVTQSVPDNYVAWSVGGNRAKNYKSTGGAKYYGKCTNTNSISVEICDDVRNGVVYPSAATINNAVALVKSLMKKYNIPVENVIRHFDVTGKLCPAYWVDNDKWLKEFRNKLTGVSTGTSANKTTAKSEDYNMKTIKKGSTGKTVRVWQVILGFSGDDVDGDFGPKTDSATKAFQKKHKLTVDGIVGAKTWKAGLESL
jgi:N-acetylmuramoyl-L-alanine amidase CwlA